MKGTGILALWFVNFNLEPGFGSSTIACEALLPKQKRRWWKNFNGDR